MRIRVHCLFAFLLWAFSISSSTAQNGLFDVRFTVKSFTCDSSKVTIAVQVRAHDMAHTFNMGDANYRFEYDPRLINNPKIVSQEHFSNIAPSSDFNYGPQNLNGSSAGTTKGIVSLNTFYTGVASSARLVDTAWTTVSCISFNVVNGTNCFPLTWHDDVTFPITGMNEVELLPGGEYNLYVVASGHVFENLQACYQANCSSGTPPSVVVTPIVTKQDSTVTVCMPITDADAGSSFTATVCGTAQHGTATPSVIGSQLCVQYVPTTGFTGADSVCVTVCDNTNKCIDVKIPITVNVRPQPPTVTPTSIVTKQDSTVTVCTTISDPDAGSTFTASLCNVPAHGTATPSVNGNQLCVTYVPTANYAGTDNVCVTVCDNTGLCTTTMIPVTVNTRPHSPTVTVVPIVTKEDSALVVCMPINDQDANSTFMAFVCGAPQHGTMSPSINGNQLCIAYNPTTGFSGQDSVCITICDNTQLCVEVKIPITVNPKPHAPTVVPTSINTKNDSTVTVCTTINDQDANSIFSATLCNNPVGGTASLLVNGNQLCIRFVPNGTYIGQSPICISVCDNTGLCTETTVPVTITRRPTPPTVSPLSITTKQDSTVTVCTTISDADPNSSFTTTLCGQAAHGTATPSVNGNQLCITYVPNPSYFGTDEVCVRVCDNTGLCTDVVVPITVERRQTPPSVFVSPINTRTDTTLTVCYPITDAEGGPFTATLCNMPTALIASPAVVGNQLCLRITTGATEATSIICINVCDPSGLCTQVLVRVQTTVPSTPPFITEIVPVVTKEDSTATVCMAVGDATPNAPYTVSVCGQGAHGSAVVSLNGTTLCLTYTPSRGYVGNDAVCVRICETATGLCTDVTVPVTVEPRTHAPTVVVTPMVTPYNTTGNLCFPITDIDANSTFTASSCGNPSHGTASLSIVNNQVCVSYTPTTGYSGSDNLCIRVCDNTGICTDVNMPITVLPAVDGRVLVGIRKQLSPNQPREVRLGNSVNYKITVKNNSTFTLSNVLVRDSIPTGMVLNQSNPQGWTANTANTIALKTIPSIASGDSVTLDISLVLLYGNPRAVILNRAYVLDASDQAGIDIIQNGQEPRDTATFMIKPFDPMGVVYCENTGFILKGGHIELVSAPAGGSIFFATDPSGTVLDGTNGTYQFFTNGVPGRYQVRYVHPNGYPLSTRCLQKTTPLDPTGNDGDATDVNGDGVIDKDGLVNDYITVGSNVVNGDHLQNFSCSNNPFWLTFDLATDDPFVFNNNIPIACAVIIGTTVGIDLNENGILDNIENALGGVTVQLYREGDLNTPIATTVTDASGNYIFDGLSQGDYRVKFIKPTGYRFTSQNINNNSSDNNDSDADPATGWTQAISLSWGAVESSIGAHFVPTNINPPTITGLHIVTKEDSVLNICLPIVDNTPSENFTPSVCGVQNGTISNVAVVNRQLCFTYTPIFGYRGDDTLCLRVCDRDGQCDTAQITLDIRAKNSRFDCAGDTIAPTITLINPLLSGVRSGDTVTYNCINPPIFGVNDARSSDNNDPNPRLSFRDVGIRRGNCQLDGFKILMECDWTATDSCGNSRIFKIFVKITDNVRPILGTTPANITVDMTVGQTIPTAPSVSATDNCGAATVVLTTDSIPTGQNCNYVLVRTWTAYDECSNTTTGVQRITVIKTCPCVPVQAKGVFTDATCGASNGTATVLVDNVQNYSFAWSANSGTGTGNARTGLAAGTYTVTVSRNNVANCQTIVTITIANDTNNCCTQPVATVTKTDATCGNSNGTATINVDTAANYIYTWSTGGSSNVSRSGLSAGNYTVTVSRVNQPNCQTVVRFTINNDVSNCCTTPQVAVTATDATCGASNGTASISVDVVGNYTFAWSPNTGTVGAFPNIRTGLAVGTYSVTVSRFNQPTCNRIVTFTIGNNTSNCCTDFIPDTTIVTPVNGCATIADVCIAMSNVNIASVTDNGAAYTSGLVACTNGLSVKLNSGTHNLVFRTTSGCLDSIVVKVVCITPRPLSIDNIMLIGTKDSIQLQTNELYGSRFTLRKIRGTTSGAVDYIILPGTLVITRSAKEIGVEYATYVITDEYGITDTTFIKTEVVSRNATRLPLALDDKTESIKGRSIFIDVMQNDSVRGTLKGITILSKPRHGSAAVTTDNRIVFVPVNGYCGKDELTYALCNGNGCDTATVQISILCDGVKVFNGFSPNGDGVNDNFTIEGIEAYPNNILNIYNRWGNEVMTTKGYKNDWQGTWNGTNLPDGTYFYIFDDGNGKVYKGFVQIQR